MLKPRLQLLLLLLIIGIFHFYRLGKIPPGLSNDETNIGYEAWSIATTGRDQWGNFLPLTFKGFGNWSLPVYIYLLAPIIKLLGPQIWAVRFLGLISGLFLSWLTYLLVKKINSSNSYSLAITAAILVGITPWIFSLTNTASEVTLAMVFFMAGLYFSLERKIPISILCLALSFLTYYGMWGFIPLYILFLLFFSGIKLNLNKKTIFLILILFLVASGLILAISFIQRGNARLGQVNSLVNIAAVGELNSFRGSCLEHYPVLACKLIFNKIWLATNQFINNYASHFSTREWFIIGGNPGILPPGGYFYLIQFPLLAIGLWRLLRQGSRLEKSVLILWLLLSPIPDSLSGTGNFTRAFIMAPVIAILGAYGLNALSYNFRLLAWAIIGFSIFRFGLLYSSYFPKFNSLYTHYEYQPLFQDWKSESETPIFISSRFRDTKQYIFLLFYQKIKPTDFQKNIEVDVEEEENGWLWVKKIGNWNFVKSIPTLQSLPPKSILIGATKEEIDPFIDQYYLCDEIEITKLKDIKFLNGDPAFTAIQTIKKNADMEKDICPKNAP